ncbi:MAG: phage tail protein [Spirulina sp.]
MVEPFLGQISMFGFNFAPRGWATCSGQLLPINQNTALFSLLGTLYGGDGRTSFALPDLRGRVPMNMGTGAGLTPRTIGSRGGEEVVTLNVSEIPSHNHSAAVQARGQSENGNNASPENAVWAREAAADAEPYNTSAPNVNMRSDAVTVTINPTGGSQAHNNMQPYLVINFCIALQGIYPSRS